MIRIGSRLYVVGGVSDKKPLGDLWEANTVKLPLEKARVIDHSEIEISSVVGAGNFSQVRKGFWNNQLVAFKMIKSNPKEKNRQKAVQDFKSEVELLSQLKHANLVNFLGYCLDPNAIIMEYLPQNLHDFLIENRSKLEKQQLVDFAFGTRSPTFWILTIEATFPLHSLVVSFFRFPPFQILRVP